MQARPMPPCRAEFICLYICLSRSQWRLQTAIVGAKGGAEILEGGPGDLGAGSPPAGSRGRAPVVGLGDKVPQRSRSILPK